MRDALDLNFRTSIGRFISPSPEITEHGMILKEISSLREKLEYYNSHICSLSYYFGGEGLHWYGQYDSHSGYGQIFLRKESNANDDPDFEIYLQVRQKEIDRLKVLLQENQEYLSQLKTFIEMKAGQYRPEELRVISNEFQKFLANGGGVVPDHLLGKNDEINLEPGTPSQRQEYNLYLYNYVQELINDPSKFHILVEEKYDGFLYKPAATAFVSQINKALDKEKSIATEIRRVEMKFAIEARLDYLDGLYPYKIGNHHTWQSALLNAFVNGMEYDFSSQKLTIFDVKALIHAEQVFEYYKYLLRLKKGEYADNTKDLLQFLIDSGEKVEPARIEFNNDGTHKVTAWNIGKSAEEIYHEKVEQINKEVLSLKSKLYSNLTDENLTLLRLNLLEVIHLYKDENDVLKDNPEWKEKLTQEFLKAADRLTGFLKIAEEKIQYRSVKKPTGTKQTNQILSTQNEDNSLEYINKGIHGYIRQLEDRMKEKVSSWKKGYDKIECAAFCELLYENGYFVEGSTRIKTLKSFALSRYHLDIENALRTSKNEDRKTHKIKLRRYFY